MKVKELVPILPWVLVAGIFYLIFSVFNLPTYSSKNFSSQAKNFDPKELLNKGEIQFFGNMNARVFKDSSGNTNLNKRPSFSRSSKNRKSIVGIIEEGSRGKVLDYKKIGNSYALKIKLMDQAGSKEYHLKSNQTAWVYYNPKQGYIGESPENDPAIPLEESLAAIEQAEEFILTSPTIPDAQQNNQSSNVTLVERSEEEQEPPQPEVHRVCGTTVLKEESGPNCGPKSTTKGKDCVQRDLATKSFKRRLGQSGKEGQSYKKSIIDTVKRVTNEVNGSNPSNTTSINPAMLMALIDSESAFDPLVKNNFDDIGIAQFQFETAARTLKVAKENKNDPFWSKIDRVTEDKPPECKTGKLVWNTTTTKCIKALKSFCRTPKDPRPSLHCPYFSIRLMAQHIKQILSEDINYTDEKTNEKFSLTEKLLGDYSEESKMRFIASRYNRGYRIYNSAIHQYENTGSITAAKNYIDLWSTKRPENFKFRSSTKRKSNQKVDKYGGGNLDGHFINRCYVWNVSGLCGGFGNSFYAKYSKVLCDETENKSNGTNKGSDNKGSVN